MKAYHWGLLVLGLMIWSMLAVMWMTGPSHCTAPDAHHHITCAHD